MSTDEVGRAAPPYALDIGEPHGRAPCGPHATEEETIIPPRWCHVLLHALRRLGNRVPPQRRRRRWLG
jgi:hypothetical protein